MRDERVDDIIKQIDIAVWNYEENNFGEHPTWIILDPHTRHLLKTSKEYIVGGHVGNESNIVNHVRGMKIAQADSYRGTIIEVK